MSKYLQVFPISIPKLLLLAYDWITFKSDYILIIQNKKGLVLFGHNFRILDIVISYKVIGIENKNLPLVIVFRVQLRPLLLDSSRLKTAFSYVAVAEGL